ncbi:MAG: hypothetical protein V4662_24465 [Verrucomicrobiota bacterium]
MLASVKGVPQGSVDLGAPEDAIDAGDPDIRASGIPNIAPQVLSPGHVC